MRADPGQNAAVNNAGIPAVPAALAPADSQSAQPLPADATQPTVATSEASEQKQAGLIPQTEHKAAAADVNSSIENKHPDTRAANAATLSAPSSEFKQGVTALPAAAAQGHDQHDEAELGDDEQDGEG